MSLLELENGSGMLKNMAARGAGQFSGHGYKVTLLVTFFPIMKLGQNLVLLISWTCSKMVKIGGKIWLLGGGAVFSICIVCLKLVLAVKKTWPPWGHFPYIL